MASNKQLVVSNTTSQMRIRTNISLLKPIEIYVHDENESVPYAFMLGMHTIRTGKGGDKALLSGYFSALCAVLPDLTKVAYEVLENLGFQVKEVMVPSQADVKYSDFRCYDHRVEVLSFAQLIYIPFTKNFNRIYKFWSVVAQNAGTPSTIYLVPQSDVVILYSTLTSSGLLDKLRGEAYLSQQALTATGTPFGTVFSKANARFRYEVENLQSYEVAYHLYKL